MSQKLTCRILLAGLEPNGYTTVQRNVISIQYNDSVTSDIILKHCSFVRVVKVMLSHDPDFDFVVESKGGRVEYPTRWSDPIPPMESMNQYGDRHQNVESPLKTICKKDDTAPHFTFSPPKTTPEFFSSYYICWMINSETRVLTRDDKLLQGKQSILINCHLLPEHLKVVNIPSPDNSDTEFGLVCDRADFFSDRKFKVCVWDDEYK